MIRIAYWVAGKPEPYKRVRDHRGFTYSPRENEAWRALVRAGYHEAMALAGWSGGHDKAVILAVAFHGSRGDLSNLLKEVEDALNGEAYTDDRQVYQVQVARGLDPDHAPGAHVTLTFTDDEPFPKKHSKPRAKKAKVT